MVMLNDLRPASFRGARFAVPHDTVEQGRIIIDHLYPDSNVRYAEDNGLAPPEFKLTCILHGANLLSQYKALAAALNAPGPGTLHHPWYGAQFVAAKTWHVKREDRDSGVLEIEACFLVTGPAVFPGKAGAIAALVTGLSANFVAGLFQSFVTAYGSPALSLSSTAFVAGNVQDVASNFLNAFQSVPAAQTSAGHLYDAPERYVLDASAMASELTTMFRSPFEDVTVAYTGNEIADAMTSLGQVATAQIAIAVTLPVAGPTATLDYQVRSAALYTFSTYVALATLSSMAEAFSGATFVTATQVSAAETQLLALYAAIPLETLDSATLQGIQGVLAAALDVLRQQELRLPNISDLEVNGFPASVLAYMLYDSDERTDALVDLNQNENPALLSGDVNILIGFS